MKRVILLVALIAVLAATAGCNWAPVISKAVPGQWTLNVAPGDVIHFSAVAGDWNSDPLTYTWAATGGSPTSGTGQEFTWTAPGLGTFTVTVSVSDGVWTTKRSWTVYVGIKEDFESGSTGWVATGLWHRQQNNSSIYNVAVPDYVVLPIDDTTDGYIPYAWSGQYCYWFGSASGAGTQGNYLGTQIAEDAPASGGTSTAPQSGTLTSPEFHLGNLQNPVLQFQSWFEIEGSNPVEFDLMTVSISANGGAFVTLGTLNPLSGGDGNIFNIAYTSGGYDTPACWELRSFDLSDYQGQRIRVRFEFNTRDESCNGFRGWFIDDIEIIEATAKDPSAKELNPVINRTTIQR